MRGLEQVSFREFLQLSVSLPVIDVRSESEFDRGHMGNAINIPVLNDAARAAVGTCYKIKGHEKAVVLGYELAGPLFHSMLARAYKIFPERKVLVHCYRGGLRSRIMSYLLHSAGFEVWVLIGGYKSYRSYVLETLDKDLKLQVIGGYTGTGKTGILQEVGKQCQIIDIENLVQHRGSAFGGIQLPPQPTQEQFENNLAEVIAGLNHTEIIWMEDESRMTGKLKIPDKLYTLMREAPLIFIDKSFHERSENILKTYGTFDTTLLVESTQKLARKLGDQKMKLAVKHLLDGNMQSWLDIVLRYYDQAYEYGLSQRDEHKIIKINSTNPIEFIINYYVSNSVRNEVQQEK